MKEETNSISSYSLFFSLLPSLYEKKKKNSLIKVVFHLFSYTKWDVDNKVCGRQIIWHHQLCWLKNCLAFM